MEGPWLIGEQGQDQQEGSRLACVLVGEELMETMFLTVLSVDCSCGMSHELRSLIIPQREAEELVFLETLAHPGTRLPAQLGVILNNLQAVLSF